MIITGNYSATEEDAVQACVGSNSTQPIAIANCINILICLEEQNALLMYFSIVF